MNISRVIKYLLICIGIAVLTSAYYVYQVIGVVLDLPAEISGKVSDPASSIVLSQGKLEGFSTLNQSYAWLGIPYGKAARWSPPTPALGWEGTMKALNAGSKCPQINPTDFRMGLPESERGKVVGSEDCLFLNVHAPVSVMPVIAKNTSQKRGLPVVVAFHAGGNSVGWGSRTDFSKFASEMNVVVVSLNYRLGLFGWFYNSKLNDDLDGVSSAGNYGTLDMIMALRWIQSNIDRFGGDSSNVTIYGGSAGAKNVLSLMMTPYAKGLFHRVIAMSGITNGISLQQASNLTDDLVPGITYSSGEVMISLLINDGLASDRNAAKRIVDQMSAMEFNDYLHSKSIDQILSVPEPDEYGKYSDSYFYLDGNIFPKASFFQTLGSGPLPNAVPAMIGITRDEAKLFQVMEPEEFLDQKLFGLKTELKSDAYFETAAEFRTKTLFTIPVHYFASKVSEHNDAPVYQYRFDWDEHPSHFLVKNLILDLDRVIGASHMIDMPFFLNDFRPNSISLPLIFIGDHDVGARDSLAKFFQSYVREFIENGAPGAGVSQELVKWEAWSNTDGEAKYLIFDTEKGGGIRPSPHIEEKENLVRQLFTDELPIETNLRCRILGRALKEEHNYDLGSQYSDFAGTSQRIADCVQNYDADFTYHLTNLH